MADVTDDFVVWANDHELVSLPVDVFAELAPKHVYDVYAERGWLTWLEENA